jgi:serine/threonine protein kinase
MDRRYEAYCLVDPVYYDNPALRTGRNPDFPATARPMPAGWTARPSDDWWHVIPPDHRSGTQGWKIHVSATLENAERVLDVVWDHCTREAVAFKFIRSRAVLLLRNSKYADRGSSGKLVTIYPSSEAELGRILGELDARLTGEQGPYILSDLRWNQGPLYVRYGGFVPRFCTDETGTPVPAIADPNGVLVPDRKGPAFAPPPWVRLPDFLMPQLAARNATAAGDLPYRVEAALHFSNGGGVYRAVDPRTGRQLVLKEARPHAGLLGNGEDAVARLRHEHDILRLLSGSSVAPEVLDYFTLGEHHFLALEYIEGRALNTFFSERYPLGSGTPDPGDVDRYTQWALKIQASTEHAIDVLHSRGVVFNDLHLFNIMVRPDDSVALIDFEVAAPVAHSGRQLLANRAFQAPADRTGFSIDRYALACLRLALFMPLTSLFALDRSRATAVAEAVRSEFPGVPTGFLDEAVHEITGGEHGSVSVPTTCGPTDISSDASQWPKLREALANGIKNSATPERTDRLFPGDIRQFTHPGGGVGLAYGAAGVLYALHRTGVPIEPQYEDWLLRAAASPRPDMRPGLYDGLHGVAHVLDLLGHSEAAQRMLSMAVDARWQRLGPDLSGGLSGVGLNLLHFFGRTGDTNMRDAAFFAATLVADRLGGPTDVDTVSGGAKPRAGLMHGSSGPALLFIHLFEETGDEAWLDLADTALRQDLRRCVMTAGGTAMQVNEGWRTMPYLGQGSAGISLVLRRFLGHRQDEQFATANAAILRTCTSRYYVQPGLFAGRAGMILTLTANGLGSARLDTDGPDTVPADQIRRLSWHAVNHQGDLAFPGEQLLRLSTDLATGSAGILLALGAALHDAPVHLPFLEAAPSTVADASAHRLTAASFAL